MQLVCNPPIYIPIFSTAYTLLCSMTDGLSTFTTVHNILREYLKIYIYKKFILHQCILITTKLYKPPSKVRAVLQSDVTLPATLLLTTLILQVENAVRPVTVALLSGGETVLLLESCSARETLGSHQPELENTLLSTAALERFCSSAGPLRNTSYLVITPAKTITRKNTFF